MKDLFQLDPVRVPTRSGSVFPVGRVLCIGRNYAAHASEMGGDVRSPPFHFTKSASAVLVASPEAHLVYPPHTGNLHHEVELVVALRAGGRDLVAQEALAGVYGYAVGLDLTRRDLQAAAKASGRPWAAAKDFDDAAVCGRITAASDHGHPGSAAIVLSVNGEPRQRGDLSQMTWSVAGILVHLSQLMTLRAGDLIFTGTPAGVGPLVPGDHLHAEIDGLDPVDLRVHPARASAAE